MLDFVCIYHRYIHVDMISISSTHNDIVSSGVSHDDVSKMHFVRDAKEAAECSREAFLARHMLDV